MCFLPEPFSSTFPACILLVAGWRNSKCKRMMEKGKYFCRLTKFRTEDVAARFVGTMGFLVTRQYMLP